MKIPFLHLKRHNLSFEKEYKKAFDRFLNSGDYILGEEVKKFEKDFSKLVGTKYATGVSNCLDGLELLLKAINIQFGDEVLVPSNTYIATWLAIVNVGAIPVPIEPDINTFNINPENLERNISKKTKAIIVVHLYGLTCPMDEINAIAKKHSLYVFEDAAQSHASKYKNRTAGALGDAGAFSFYPSKNIGALGDAGIITTNSKEIWQKTKILRNYGSSVKYENEMLGRNNRLDELQAAFLRIRLKNIENENTIRNKLAERYISNLSILKNSIKLPSFDSNNYLHTWHLFVVLVDDRETFQDYLYKNGINTMIHYPIPPHKQKAFSHHPLSKSSFPISEEIHKKCISLPISALHSFDEIDFVSDIILKRYKN